MGAWLGVSGSVMQVRVCGCVVMGTCTLRTGLDAARKCGCIAAHIITRAPSHVRCTYVLDLNPRILAILPTVLTLPKSCYVLGWCPARPGAIHIDIVCRGQRVPFFDVTLTAAHSAKGLSAQDPDSS